MIKLKATTKQKKIVALNEINIHHKLPTKAIRFYIKFGKNKIINLIGDGVIIATPFGSTGYYKSVGGKFFSFLLSPIFGGSESLYALLVALIAGWLIYCGLGFASKLETTIVVTLIFLFIFIFWPLLAIIPNPTNFSTH